MASPWLKRAFISSESDCSGPTAKRQELESGANQERDSPALVNNIQPPNHKNFLSANPQRDLGAPVFSPQPEGESDLQFSETCFGMV